MRYQHHVASFIINEPSLQHSISLNYGVQSARRTSRWLINIHKTGCRRSRVREFAPVNG